MMTGQEAAQKHAQQHPAENATGTGQSNGQRTHDKNLWRLFPLPGRR
jgi:hypothetical protein